MRANHGSNANMTNDMTRAGEVMSAKLLSFDNWVPALTYTMVPNNIPI